MNLNRFKSTLILFFAITACFLSSTLHAQLYIDNQGNTGIGTSSPDALFEVKQGLSNEAWGLRLYHHYIGTDIQQGLYTRTFGSPHNRMYGIFNYSTSDSASADQHRGLYNYTKTNNDDDGIGIYNWVLAGDGSSDRYGIYNWINCDNNTGQKYALYSGVSCSGSGVYAGYFNGDVYVSGTVTQTSDARRKTDVAELGNAMDLIRQLNPKTYHYLTDASLALPEERQFGFLAQDLEQVLPELVKTVGVPGTPETADGELSQTLSGQKAQSQLKSVNYIALIPILVKALQEQQAEIEALKKAQR